MISVLNPQERESIIITLEGGEGSGKTELEKNLRKKFVAKGLRMMPSLKEPGSTPRAELIRMVLKNTIDTTFSLPISVREGFNLDDFLDQAKRDPLTDYGRGNLGVVLSQLSSLSIKHGILEYVYNGCFGGMPSDCFDKDSIKTQMYLAGNSRQLNPLVQLVQKLNLEVREGVEKTGLVLSELKEEKLSPDHQARLFLIARNLLYHNIIGPAMHRKYNSNDVDGRLGEFDLLINDRSCESTVVYQGHAQNPSQVENLRRENLKAMEGILPDLTLYLDVSPEVGIKRTRTDRGILGEDFFDSKTADFHQKVREGYKMEKKYYGALPPSDSQYERIVEINAHKSIEDVADSAWNVISNRLSGKIKRIEQLNKAK